MKLSYARRYRPGTSSARETGLFKKDSRQEPAFFSVPSARSFFQSPAVQRTCTHCAAEAKQVSRMSTPAAEETDKTINSAGQATNSQNKRAHGGCEGLDVQGHTDANYTNSYTSSGPSRPDTGCDTCAPPDCITAHGTVKSVFKAHPVVTLPSVPDGLTPCETKAVRKFINTTLRKHERQHVVAFNTYNATVRTPYSFTGCRSELDAHLQSIHDTINAERETAANEKSDALDPFVSAIPCNCDEKK